MLVQKIDIRQSKASKDRFCCRADAVPEPRVSESAAPYNLADALFGVTPNAKRSILGIEDTSELGGQKLRSQIAVIVMPSRR